MEKIRSETVKRRENKAFPPFSYKEILKDIKGHLINLHFKKIRLIYKYAFF
jgi:hypothetical protein